MCFIITQSHEKKYAMVQKSKDMVASINYRCVVSSLYGPYYLLGGHIYKPVSPLVENINISAISYV